MHYVLLFILYVFIAMYNPIFMHQGERGTKEPLIIFHSNASRKERDMYCTANSVSIDVVKVGRLYVVNIDSMYAVKCRESVCCQYISC